MGVCRVVGGFEEVVEASWCFWGFDADVVCGGSRLKRGLGAAARLCGVEDARTGLAVDLDGGRLMESQSNVIAVPVGIDSWKEVEDRRSNRMYACANVLESTSGPSACDAFRLMDRRVRWCFEAQQGYG